MERFYGLTNDYMFKAVMQENKDVLRNLIGALLGINEDDIIECELTNPIILGQSVGDKDCILDIKLVLNGDKNINIELQMRKEAYWSERSLLYWSRTYDDLKSGEDYGLLKQTYHIGIIDFPLYDGDNELFSEYRIMNIKNHRIYTDKFAIKVLNLKHIENTKDTDIKVIHWAKLFKAKTLKEIENLAGEQEVIKNMVLTLKKLTEDEKIKQQMEARADYESRIATARGAGYRDGIAQGREETNSLYEWLILNNRDDEMRRSIKDKCLYEKLLMEYKSQKYMMFVEKDKEQSNDY